MGSNATFGCKSQADARWYFNYAEMHGSKDILIRKSTLVIKNVKLHHYGRYTCFGRYKNRIKYFYTHALLKVYGKLYYVIHLYT